MSVLEELLELVEGAEARSNVIDNGRAGTKVRFLVADKLKIMTCITQNSIPFSDVCMHLAQAGRNYSTWSSRFYAWQKDFEKGKLDCQLAVAIQRAQPNPRAIDSLKLLVEHRLNSGCTVEEIVERVGEIAVAWKEMRANEVRGEVEALLASKGLTIADLK